MTTPVVTPKVVYNNVSESVPYNFNVPIASEVELIVEFVDGDGNDISADTNFTILTSASMGSLLLDTNSVEVEWVGLDPFPTTNTLTIFRKTSELQQTVYEFNADISIETAQEVDRLTRFQQDANEKLDELDATIATIEGNINPIIVEASLADGSVTTPKIADLNVTEAKLATQAVTQSKLASSSVSADKIIANAVTESKIQNTAVTEAKLADNSVSTIKIQDAAITEAKLADTAVTSAKLAQDVLDRFDQNIPFKFSVSTFSNKRLRIEAAEIELNDESKKALGTGTSIITFDGIEIDFVTGSTYSLSNVLISPAAFSFPVPSVGQYRTYLIQATFGAVNVVGKTPIVLDIVGGQQSATLGNQVYPELGLNQELALGYVTVQESGGTIADLVSSNLITLDNTSNDGYSNIDRVRVVSHVFNVGDKLIPVYWSGTEWLPADGTFLTTLATHLILEVISNEEFILAYSGRIFMPAHGLTAGAFYFLGEDAGVLSLIEADNFSNPLLQVEDEDYFTLLGWRANEKTITTDVTGVERINIPSLVSSTPTLFVSALADIYSISVYNTLRKKIDTDEIEIRIDDINPSSFTLFSTSNWADLRVDLIGVK